MNKNAKRALIVVGSITSAVAGFEGYQQRAYLDPVGIPTICFGETKGVKLGDWKSKEDCEGLLTQSLLDHESGMRACINEPERVPDQSYGAFVSFTYNVGVGAFCRSTLTRKLNSGDLRGACNQLPRWNKAGGRVLHGLTVRRNAELKMCLDGMRAQSNG